MRNICAFQKGIEKSGDNIENRNSSGGGGDGGGGARESSDEKIVETVTMKDDDFVSVVGSNRNNQRERTDTSGWDTSKSQNASISGSRGKDSRSSWFNINFWGKRRRKSIIIEMATESESRSLMDGSGSGSESESGSSNDITSNRNISKIISSSGSKKILVGPTEEEDYD